MDETSLVTQTIYAYSFARFNNLLSTGETSKGTDSGMGILMDRYADDEELVLMLVVQQFSLFIGKTAASFAFGHCKQTNEIWQRHSVTV